MSGPVTGTDRDGEHALVVLHGSVGLHEQLRSREEISTAYESWQEQDDRIGRVRSALPRIPAPPPYWTASGPAGARP